MISMSTNEYAVWGNSYGLIRSPWNNYNSLTLGRFIGGGAGIGMEPTISINETQMATCSVLEWTLNLSRTLVAFNVYAEGQAHGPIHMYTAGQSNTPNLPAKLLAIGIEATSQDWMDQMWGAGTVGVPAIFAHMKSLWRYDQYHCPTHCSMDTPLHECKCVCDADAIWADSTYRELFSTTISMFGNESTYKFIKIFCSTNVALGDHGTSSSGSDPSFWVLHSTVERYLQVLKLGDNFVDGNWTHENAVFSSNKHPNSEGCWGHYAEDALVFGSVDGRNFSNLEYYRSLNPINPHTPYVYDNFHFDHCSRLGYDIGF